jgi:hypothetical protein
MLGVFPIELELSQFVFLKPWKWRIFHAREGSTFNVQWSVNTNSRYWAKNVVGNLVYRSVVRIIYRNDDSMERYQRSCSMCTNAICWYVWARLPWTSNKWATTHQVTTSDSALLFWPSALLAAMNCTRESRGWAARALSNFFGKSAVFSLLVGHIFFRLEGHAILLLEPTARSPVVYKPSQYGRSTRKRTDSVQQSIYIFRRTRYCRYN